jgi:hypothetical protein
MGPMSALTGTPSGAAPISQYTNMVGIIGMHTKWGSRLRGNDVQLLTFSFGTHAPTVSPAAGVPGEDRQEAPLALS